MITPLTSEQARLIYRRDELIKLCSKPAPEGLRKGKWPPCCMGVAAMGPWHCTCSPVERYYPEIEKIEKQLGIDKPYLHKEKP